MKKVKLASLLSLIGVAAASATVLVGCNNGGNLKPQVRARVLNCYSNDYSVGIKGRKSKAFDPWVSALSDTMKTQYYKGYVGTEDSVNAGPFRIVEGSDVAIPGQDIDFIIELDPLVELNPVVGTPLEGEYDYPTFAEGALSDDDYCKVYMTDTYTDVGFLPKKCYKFKHIPDSNRWSFHLPGEYTQYSYDILISSSYVDFRKYMIEKTGQETKVFYNGDTSENFVKSTDLLKFQSNANQYNIAVDNWRVGDTNFSFTLRPLYASSQATFTQEFADSLTIKGIPFGSKSNANEHEFKEVIKTLSSDYSLLPSSSLIGSTKPGTILRRAGAQNLTCAIPFINQANPEEGLFKVNSKGGYDALYEGIELTIGDKFEGGLPIMFVDDKGIDSRFELSVIGGPEGSTAKATAEIKHPWQFVSKQIDPKMGPVIHIHIDLDENYRLAGSSLETGNKPIKSFVLTSALDDFGNPYINDIDLPNVTFAQYNDQIEDKNGNIYPSISSMLFGSDKNPVVANDGSGTDFYIPIVDFVAKSQIAAGSTDVNILNVSQQEGRLGSANFFSKLQIVFQEELAQ